MWFVAKFLFRFYISYRKSFATKSTLVFLSDVTSIASASCPSYPHTISPSPFEKDTQWDIVYGRVEQVTHIVVVKICGFSGFGGKILANLGRRRFLLLLVFIAHLATQCEYEFSGCCVLVRVRPVQQLGTSTSTRTVILLHVLMNTFSY